MANHMINFRSQLLSRNLGFFDLISNLGHDVRKSIIGEFSYESFSGYHLTRADFVPLSYIYISSTLSLYVQIYTAKKDNNHIHK